MLFFCSLLLFYCKVVSLFEGGREDPIRLGLALNYSVFYSEIMASLLKGISMLFFCSLLLFY
jgi:hypothetical protein